MIDGPNGKTIIRPLEKSKKETIMRGSKGIKVI